MSLTIRRTALWLACIPVALLGQERKPVAGVPYQYWDVLEADGASRKIYFRNDSPNPITITQVVVQRCDNTRQLCGTYPASLVVAPGKTVVAFKGERLDKKLGWSFSYTFRTSGASSGIPSPVVMRGGDGSAVGTMQTVSIDSLVPSVPAWTEGATCGSLSVPDLPAGHQALIMIFGTATQPTARRVMIRVDANKSA